MAETREYGALGEGGAVRQYSLRNKNGMEVRCIDYGCRITNILLPAKDGPVDVVLGFDGLAGYEADKSACHGAFVGRYANRIEGARLEVGGKEYRLTLNDGGNFLHGSFANRLFEGEVIGETSVTFTYTSPDGEDGFPGELWLGVTYTLTDQNELIFDYRAVSRADTHINLTNHSYFNLSGDFSRSIEDHLLWLNSRHFLEADAALCPTGRMPAAAGGAFDFTREKPIGRDIGAKDPQLEIGGGYDHCFILEKESPTGLAQAARALHPQSGRALLVYTTQPAVQFYTGNFLDGTPGKGGLPMARRSGFCLETQHYPCTPSHPDFPPTLLRAGEKFHELTVLQFEF